LRIERIKLLPGKSISCPTAFNQFCLIFQFEYFFTEASFVPFIC
jgi:hypothetical protein